ncbi:class I SAM-dependent methyltransferase [Actinopolymorpha sp. B11F2]|uniref:class I SAM-dependent methyltransferase n=1 Tax=Actinopolymorpha sp. B11F2 TaxID=3160862 RepID=UPI0032E4FA79
MNVTLRQVRSHGPLRAVRWPMLGMGSWVVLVAGFASITRPGTPVVAVLLAFGPVLGGLLHLQLQNRALLRRLDRMAKAQVTTTKDVAATRQRLDAVADATASRTVLSKLLKDTASDVITRTRRGVAVDLLLTYRQLEALQNIYAVAGVDRPMPPTRGWASSPDLLLLLADLVERARPSLIVECGSGTSTLWFAMVLRRFEIPGRVIALEHQQQFVDNLRDRLDGHGLGGLVDVRYAPLEPVRVGEAEFQWYARDAWKDLKDVDLLFVDGPPGILGEHARLPALPLLADHLHPDGVVVLDDMIRTDEQEVLAEWLRTCPDFTAEEVPLEKNAALLRRRRPSGS